VVDGAGNPVASAYEGYTVQIVDVSPDSYIASTLTGTETQIVSGFATFDSLFFEGKKL
jgi:hypothetical protein